MKDKIVVIGLGYVGLPLAVEFAKKFEVIGFDINKSRIEELQSNIDSTLEVASETLKATKGIILTDHYFDDVLQTTTKNIVISEGKSSEVLSKEDLIKMKYLSKNHM